MTTYATRVAYGEELALLGRTNPNIVALDADLAKATMSITFKEEHPDHFFDIGIAEANMICAAAGMASIGKIPFASTFAVFAAGRAFEQVRNGVCYPCLNVKIVGTHSGIIVGADGATHQAFEDIAIIRSLPNMTIICPGDAVETRAAVRFAADHHGPVYLRLGRLPTPVIFDDTHALSLGKGFKLKEGNDITIVSTGTLLQTCLDAAKALDEEGIGSEVIHLPFIKPLDEELLVASAAKTGRVLTVEDGTVEGGMGNAVSACLSRRQPTRMRLAGIQDTFGKSGEAEELLAANGLDTASVVGEARSLCKTN